MANYKPVIGLEVHVELKTKSKMFCQCDADYFGKLPNSNTCPVCLGLPGALPVPNKKAVEWTMRIGKALGCTINSHSKFDRKHYFYPDLPKGYQISQYDEPIASKGTLNIPISNIQFPISKQASISKFQLSNKKTFRIHRVHLEEDTGKLLHVGMDTLVDFNRSGVQLVEIVTEPDFDNSDDVKAFLEELQTIIRYLDVSGADMEKGSMRLEPNISVSRISNSQYPISKQASIPKFQLPNYKVEVKNINSFRFVKQAIEYEVERQIGILEKGETPIQETRGFDEKKVATYSQRSKEQAHDYRYFPEPDIPPMEFSSEEIALVATKLPELPGEKVSRYVGKLGLRHQDAYTLTRDKDTASYFEDICFRLKKEPTVVKNAYQLIANMIINKKLSTSLSSDEFLKHALEQLAPKQTDEKTLDAVINQEVKVNTKVVADYKSGKKNAIMFLVGQVMREMKGKADPKLVREKLIKKLT